MKVFQVSTGQSPVLGCLLVLGIVAVAGLLIVGAGLFVLIAPLGLLVWRVIEAFLPEPAGQERVQTPTTQGVIDVEATVLPPSLESEKRHGDWEN